MKILQTFLVSQKQEKYDTFDIVTRLCSKVFMSFSLYDVVFEIPYKSIEFGTPCTT